MSESFSIKEIRALKKDGEIELPITLKLRKPIQLTETDVIKEVTFSNEPTAADVADMPVANQVMSDFYRPIAKMTGQTLPILRKLKVLDLQACMEVAQPFLTDSET